MQTGDTAKNVAHPACMNTSSKGAHTMQNDKTAAKDDLQDDDTKREDQKSHGDQQNRSKKDGHTSQIGTSQDQTSQRNRGGGARRPD